MERKLRKIAAKYSDVCTKAALFGERHANAFLFVLGVALVSGGIAEYSIAQGAGPTGSFSEAAYDDQLVRSSVGNLFRLIEGAFGALIMVVSGLGAIVAAAMGAYRAAVGMLVVAVGAFILRALVSLFFGTDFESFDQT